MIINCDGQTVETVDDLSEILETHQVGDTITLTIVRDGTRMDVSATLGEDRTGPVSYTHLDVYKRQHPHVPAAAR